MKTLIENAIVLTMDDEMRVFDRGYVLTDGVHIAEVGAGRFAGAADERIVARGGKLTRLDMEEAKAKLLEQMGPFMQSAAKYADII